MYRINEFEVLEIIDQAVAFGVESLNGQHNTLALQIASFWLEGYIAGRKNEITEDDITSLRNTLKNFCFM